MAAVKWLTLRAAWQYAQGPHSWNVDNMKLLSEFDFSTEKLLLFSHFSTYIHITGVHMHDMRIEFSHRCQILS